MTGDFLLETFLTLAAVLFLVLLNGFFVASEFSLVKVRDTQLVTLASRGHKRARIARKVIANLDAALSATQLGITLASLGLGWFAEPAFEHLLQRPLDFFGLESEEARKSVSFAVGFSIITFLHIVLGELAPKSMAIQRPLPTTLWIAAPMSWFERLSFPAIWALNGTSLWMLRKVGIEPMAGSEHAHSAEELRLLLSSARGNGVDAALGRNIVLNAFDLRTREAREVMRPRKEIVVLGADWAIERCLEIAERTRFSRFPLCEGGDVDRTLGVIHVKDLYALRSKAQTGAELIPAAKKIIYVPETCRLEKLLSLYLERKLHFAIVVDEYGGTIGMVTLENVLEALVGQIQDEFDQEKPLLVPVGEREWDLDGAFGLHELEALVEMELDADQVGTAGGFVTQRLGGFPHEGDVVELRGYSLRVTEMDGMRVARLRLSKTCAESDTPAA